jgi:hypothetical protein
MPMLMMHVGHMGMRVHQSRMLMLMHVGFAGRVLGPMGMLVMFIMRVNVRMSYRFISPMPGRESIGRTKRRIRATPTPAPQ